MKILITGGTGFVGSQLSQFWLRQGHWVTVIGSRPSPKSDGPEQLRHLQADTTEPGLWQDAVREADAIVNLAGRSIFHRWSRKYKQALYDSRILTTRHLVAAMPSESRQTLISASAVGYYGNGIDTVLTEEMPMGTDFLATLSGDWEAEALRAQDKGVRVVIARLGIVLGMQGGALATMLTAFRSFVGGPVGSGRQWVSWIHIRDVLAAIDFLLTHAHLQGPFNAVAPHPVRNQEMATLIGHLIHRPAKMPAPAMALRLMLGELADVVLASQRVAPVRLQAEGFSFSFNHLDQALLDLLAVESHAKGD